MEGLRTLALDSTTLRVELIPELGGKIVGLRVPGGREWLAQRSGEAGLNQDVFGAEASFGWDELFPTVLPGDVAPPPWTGTMRDHGDLWGRAWRVVDRSATAVRLVFDDPAGRYRFWRTATITSSGLALRYAVENRTSADLPFLWSMHPILSVKPGDQILLPGIARVRATFLRHPKLKEASVLPWPEAQGLENEPVRLDLIGPWDGVTSAKLYAGPMPQSATGVVGSDGWLLFEADTSVAAFVGMYLNYGGWPEPGSRLHQIGLELTTAPVDDLAAAVAGGYHRVVPPLGRLDWSAAVLVGLRKDAIPAWMTTTTT